ncbi:MAG: hypothetical protein WA477_06755 [Candidatus Sulfotelmatobacter sp.]
MPLRLHLGAVQTGKGTTDLPKTRPRGMRFADLNRVLGRNVGGVTLAVFPEGQVQVRTMTAGRIGVASASWLSALSGSFGEATLNHALGSMGELLEKRFSLTHTYMIKTQGK